MNNYIVRLKIVFVFCVVVLVFAFLFLIFRQNRERYSQDALEEFAKCLSGKNIVMYGNYNCPHCQSEKAAFGQAFKFIKYIECTENIKLCVEAKIGVVPTWIFPDNKKLVGLQGIEKLSRESGCEIK